jgi:hypothetical protein
MQSINLKSRVLRNIFGTPIIIVPFLLGLGCLILSFEGARSLRFLGFAFWFVSFSTAFLRLTVFFDVVVHSTFAKICTDRQTRRDEELDALDAKLSADSEPRNEEALRKLRQVYKVFTDAAQVGVVRNYDFLDTAEKLFATCIRNLEESYSRRSTAMQIIGMPTSQQLLKASGELLEEVEAGLKSLSDSLVEIQNLNVPRKNDLAKICAELDERLKFAKEVEEKIQSNDWLVQ